jgi:hypothetical protein
MGESMIPTVQVFAVLRVDADGTPSPGSTGPGIALQRFRGVIVRDVSVVFLVPTMEEAVKEVERLNTLNASKSCTYFWMTTRYYPQGRGIDTQDEA